MTENRDRGMRVYRLDEGDAGEWQAYVRGSPQATLFHDLRFSRAVERAFHHRPIHLVARRRGRLCGILPLFEVRSVFSGRTLVSVPYGVYGGIAADSEAAAAALLETATRLAWSLGVRAVELRHLEPNGFPLPAIEGYVTFVKALPDSEGACLERLPRKARAAARQAIHRYGLRAEFGPHLLEAVYDLYARNVRRLGSPVYPRTFFRELAGRFGGQCVCQVVRHETTIVAALLSFTFKDRMMPYYSGSLPSHQHMNPNNFLYLKAMEYGVAHGCRWFDFGRTRRQNTGPYQFKVNQGFSPQPLPYQMIPVGARRVDRVDPGQERFRLAQRVWSRLPLSATRWMGGLITRSIP